MVERLDQMLVKLPNDKKWSDMTMKKMVDGDHEDS